LGRSCKDLFKPDNLLCELDVTERTYFFDPEPCTSSDDAIDNSTVAGTNCTDYLSFVDGEFMVECEGGEVSPALVLAPMLVTPGDLFTVRREDNGTLPAIVKCTVYDNFGREAQEVSFDGSLNVNAYELKTRVGSLTFVGCGAKQCIHRIRYRYEVSNDGIQPMTVGSLTLIESGGLHRSEDLKPKLETCRLGPGEVEALDCEETQKVDVCGLCDYQTTIRVKGSPLPDNGLECQAQSVYRLKIEPAPATG
jgi:hypothetical protein